MGKAKQYRGEVNFYQRRYIRIVWSAVRGLPLATIARQERMQPCSLRPYFVRAWPIIERERPELLPRLLQELDAVRPKAPLQLFPPKPRGHVN